MSAFIYVAPDLAVLGMSVVFGPSDGWALKRPALVAFPDLIRARAATALSCSYVQAISLVVLIDIR